MLTNQVIKIRGTQDDDSYYFVINQKHDDTPAYHVFYDNFPLAADENAPVQVLYNKDGIQFLQLEKVFAFTEQESNYDLKPFEEIAEVIETKIRDAVRWAVPIL